jgi:mevalonate kinase
LTKSTIYRSNGKLLITGEYVVLDGAKALAIPTKYGQSLKVMPLDEPQLIWRSYTNNKTVWFNANISLQELNEDEIYYDSVLDTLVDILKVAKQLNPNFLSTKQGYKVSSYLEFPNNWGLGTSSTLINSVADWAKVDAYDLLKQSFGGSAYDIACARNNTPITYQLTKESRVVTAVDFNPTFKNHLYFVYLNQKQNSREGIANYKALNKVDDSIILEINAITDLMLSCDTLAEFHRLVTLHESIISKLILQEPIKKRLFSDFNGTIKSLGAWGGDFVLVASDANPIPYFKGKGFDTVIHYSEMVL